MVGHSCGTTNRWVYVISFRIPYRLYRNLFTRRHHQNFRFRHFQARKSLAELFLSKINSYSDRYRPVLQIVVPCPLSFKAIDHPRLEKLLASNYRLISSKRQTYLGGISQATWRRKTSYYRYPKRTQLVRYQDSVLHDNFSSQPLLSINFGSDK